MKGRFSAFLLALERGRDVALVLLRPSPNPQIVIRRWLTVKRLVATLFSDTPNIMM
jgi:hypothetical protein